MNELCFWRVLSVKDLFPPSGKLEHAKIISGLHYSFIQQVLLSPCSPASGGISCKGIFACWGFAFGRLGPGIWWTYLLFWAWWGFRDRLGLWDAALAARLQKVGHCYTFQPHQLIK